mgnify:FL=1
MSKKENVFEGRERHGKGGDQESVTIKKPQKQASQMEIHVKVRSISQCSRAFKPINVAIKSAH